METNVGQLNKIEQLAWAGLVSKGISSAISGLSQMVGKEVKPTTLTTRESVPLKDLASLLGGPDKLAAGIYLKVSGAATGHLMLIHQPGAALELIDMLMGVSPGTTQTLGDMEQSALGEMGNVMGSFFLNALSDSTGMTLYPSPPAVMMDMAGAILDVAVSDIIQDTDDVCIVESKFGTQDQQINGVFLIMPSPSLLQALRQYWSVQ